MLKRLTKQGNSVALILDKPLLEAVQIDAGAEVEVSTNGDCIVVTPVRDKKRQAKFRATWERVKTDFAGAFRRLAK
jgi:antitoxin component of MazEF toxin-antitoxin module